MEINGGTDTVKAKYYHGITPIGMRTSGGQLYYTTSYNGTVEKVTNLGGGVVADYTYDAFGNQTDSTADEIYNPFRYCGEYYDEETGLTYLRNRYYDSSIGAFINEDPIRDGLNWYVYCESNPVAFVDPLGLAPTPEEAAAMADHIYHYDQYDSYADRIVKVDEEYTAWRLIDVESSSSLKIGIYVKTDRNHTWDNPLEYALVFKGTEFTNMEDWENNLEQFEDECSKHLIEGLVYSSWFVREKEDYEITFVGHSKGGGEAAVNAEFFNKNAIVFNPSVPEITYALEDEGYVQPYVVKGDILNDVLGEIPLGTTKYLKQQHNGLLPGVSLVDQVNNHSMEAVISALAEESN